MADTTNTTSAHTYIAGEDEGRLEQTAQELGLERGRDTAMTSWADLLFRDGTMAAARMHSVGTLGSDERVDSYGTLRLMTTRRRKKIEITIPEYGDLEELFAKPVAVSVEIEEEEDSEEGKEDDESEDEVIAMVEGGSLDAACFGIIKAAVGPAILFLPRGFYISGYAVAIPAMIFATAMYIYNAYRLLECWKLESDRNHKVQTRLQEVQSLLQGATDQLQHEQYGSTEVQQDHLFTPKLLTYPELARRSLGPYAVLVEVGIMIFQFGVVLTYFIFVPQNLHECYKAVFGTELPKMYFLVAMILVEIPLSWVRDIRKYTLTNVIASLLIAFSLISILCIAFGEGAQRTDDQQLVFLDNLSTMPAITEKWFLFIGTSFYMMEGSITLLIPLQEAVYRPEDKTKFPDLNRATTSSIVLVYIIFSLICCACFGSSIKTALTASLHGTLATVVQFAYSIAVLFTHPLQAFPAMEVSMRLLDPSYGTQASAGGWWRRSIYTSIITILLGMIAVAAIDYLGNVVSLLGSLFGIPLALVFPPIMHNIMIKDAPWTTRYMNYIVMVLGFFAMGAASYNTIATWDEGAESS